MNGKPKVGEHFIFKDERNSIFWGYGPHKIMKIERTAFIDEIGCYVKFDGYYAKFDGYNGEYCFALDQIKIVHSYKRKIISRRVYGGNK